MGNNNKSFIGLKDFYNKISIANKNQNDRYVPTDYFWFNIYFYDTTYEDRISSYGLDDIRYFVNAINCPMMSIKSFKDGMSGNGAPGQMNLSNSFGNYTALGNGSRLSPDKQTFDLSIVNTGNPLIEKCIYKWMMGISNGYLGFGKGIHMVIKFWNAACVPNPTDGLNLPPNFVYLFTNIYPLNMPAWNPKHVVQQSDITRKITFSFDEFKIDPDNGVNYFGTDSKKLDTEKKLELPTKYVTYKDGDGDGSGTGSGNGDGSGNNNGTGSGSVTTNNGTLNANGSSMTVNNVGTRIGVEDENGVTTDVVNSDNNEISTNVDEEQNAEINNSQQDTDAVYTHLYNSMYKNSSIPSPKTEIPVNQNGTSTVNAIIDDFDNTINDNQNKIITNLYNETDSMNNLPGSNHDEYEDQDTTLIRTNQLQTNTTKSNINNTGIQLDNENIMADNDRVEISVPSNFTGDIKETILETEPEYVSEYIDEEGNTHLSYGSEEADSIVVSLYGKSNTNTNEILFNSPNTVKTSDSGKIISTYEPNKDNSYGLIKDSDSNGDVVNSIDNRRIKIIGDSVAVVNDNGIIKSFDTYDPYGTKFVRGVNLDGTKGPYTDNDGTRFMDIAIDPSTNKEIFVNMEDYKKITDLLYTE